MTKLFAIAAGLLLVTTAHANERGVCEVVPGQNYYSDNNVRVMKYGNEISTCAKKEMKKVTKEAVTQKETFNEKLVDMDLSTLKVQFTTGSASLDNSGKETVQKLYDVLSKNNEMKIQITGHTDSTGSETLNQTLSLKRAESIRKELISMGISETRVEAKGFGSSQPVASNSDAEGRLQNRRISVEAL